jgi:hypothetical protein
VYSDLSRQVITTGVRIWGLGWRHNYERTDPISLDDLCEITDLSRSQLYGHLGALSGAGVLCYTSTGGEFCFRFDRDLVEESAEREGEARAGPSPENRIGETIGDVVVPLSSSIREQYACHYERQQQQRHVVAVGGECEGGGDRYGNLDSESEILDRMGVVEPTRSELLRLEHVTEAYLLAWRAWYEHQTGLGIGWVITQVRAAADPPGDRQVHGHAERQRYLEWGGQ